MSSFSPLVLALSQSESHQTSVVPVVIPTPSVVASAFFPSATLGDSSLKKAEISGSAWMAFGRK